MNRSNLKSYQASSSTSSPFGRAHNRVRGILGRFSKRFAAAAAAAAAAAGLLFLIQPAQADVFPSKPVHIIVPAPPGGLTDSTVRLLGTELSRMWGQPVIVENRPGASGFITLQAVMSSDPDGHVIGVTTSGFMIVVPLSHGAKYDLTSATTPLSFLSEYPLLLVASPQSPYNNWKEFAAHIAKSGNRANYGTSGVGTSPHIVGEKIKKATGIQLQDVPYKGDMPMITDALGGQVDFSIPILGSALSMVKSGRAKGLAVTSANRVPFAPDIPTLKEQGVDVVYSPYNLVFGPPGMSPQVSARIASDIDKALKAPAMQAFFTTNALIAESLDQKQLNAKLKADTQSTQNLIKELNIPVQ